MNENGPKLLEFIIRNKEFIGVICTAWIVLMLPTGILMGKIMKRVGSSYPPVNPGDNE